MSPPPESPENSTPKDNPTRPPSDRGGPLLRLWNPYRLWFMLARLLALLAAGAALGFGVHAWLTTSSLSTVTVRSTPGVLVAVRELARLETAEVHIEKVIDLTDQQSVMFGLVNSSDALLLVAVGHATLGVDLGELGQDDITTSADGKSATLRLPEPKLLQAGLDENATYVYARTTSLLARRNEQLESKARREAIEAIKKGAMTPDILNRAKNQAERQLRTLGMRLGLAHIEITWRR